MKPTSELKFWLRKFAPKLMITFAAMLLFFLLVSLGFWQLHRAAEKNHLQKQFQERTKLIPLDLNAQADLIEKNQAQYLPVRVTGVFDSAHQFLLDNKIYQHQVGYQVLTPLILANGKAVLVNRGWITQGSNRQKLPVLQPIKGEVTLNGVIDFQKNYFTLGDNVENANWPLRIQTIDFKQIATAAHYSFFKFVILLDPNQEHGFVRAWSPHHLNSNINYGYAFQWFALAGALLVVYLVLMLRRSKY